MDFEVLQKVVVPVKEFIAGRVGAFECWCWRVAFSISCKMRYNATHVFHECELTEYDASDALHDGNTCHSPPHRRHTTSFLSVFRPSLQLF